jgi:hypothetical protein
MRSPFRTLIVRVGPGYAVVCDTAFRVIAGSDRLRLEKLSVRTGAGSVEQRSLSTQVQDTLHVLGGNSLSDFA